MRTWINWCKSASLPKWQTRFGIWMWKYCQYNNDIRMQTISNRWHSIPKFNHMFFNDATKISAQHSILVIAHTWAIHLKWHSVKKKCWSKIGFCRISVNFRVFDIKLCGPSMSVRLAMGSDTAFLWALFSKPETFGNRLKSTKNIFHKRFKKHFVRIPPLSTSNSK